MQKSYTKNYIKIYFWQFLSIVVSILSSFIVLPKLSTNPNFYGIYSICITISLYVFYLDFGFLSSASKFAGEYITKNNQKHEIKIISFSLFIFFIFIMLFSIILLVFIYKPDLIIKNIENNPLILKISKQLLSICLISIYLNILSKFINLVLDIRLENYIFYRIYVIGNILKILSVFYFFYNSKQNIVGYYLFYQIMDFFVYMFCILKIKKLYNYNIKLFIKSFHFSKRLFIKLKNFVKPSLLSLIIGLLTFELDNLIIGKIFGLKQVAYYSIALIIFRFIWMIRSTFYNPFIHRLNHFYATNDSENLKVYSLNAISIMMPIILFPTISIIIYAKNVVYTWVGNFYTPSIIISQYLLLSIIFSFIYVIPETLLFILKKNKIRSLILILYLFLYLFFLFVSIKNIGIVSFAFSKFIAMTIYFILNFYFLLNILNINIKELFTKCFKGMIIPIIFLIISLFLSKNYLPIEKSKINFMIVALFGGLLSFFATLIYYFTQKNFREYVNKMLLKTKNKFVGVG
ncbi:MAG: hypothetical protein LBF97_07500 [Elusimicrobiota bacterium]|jgi:O-antigen/teichoic acid export membrane protein|nr:hypothetical protein [Elusimicrobiota bacterium]